MNGKVILINPALCVSWGPFILYENDNMVAMRLVKPYMDFIVWSARLLLLFDLRFWERKLMVKVIILSIATTYVSSEMIYAIFIEYKYFLHCFEQYRRISGKVLIQRHIDFYFKWTNRANLYIETSGWLLKFMWPMSNTQLINHTQLKWYYHIKCNKQYNNAFRKQLQQILHHKKRDNILVELMKKKTT